MNFKKYFLGMSVLEREKFAIKCETSAAYLRNIAYDEHRTCGEDLAMKIDEASGGLVTCEELRPDLSEQWAYLRGTKKAA